MSRSNTAVTTVAPTTATRTAGIARVTRGSTSSTASVASPTREGRAVALVEVRHELAHLLDEGVGVGREPAELRQLPDDDDDGQPVHVADLDLARQQVGDEAELADTEPDLDEADEDGEHPGQGDGGGRVVAGDDERGDGGEDQRPERGVGAEHEDLRRPHRGRSRRGRRSWCTARSPVAARRARRRPCPGGPGSPRARSRPRGRSAATAARTCAATPHLARGAPRSSTVVHSSSINPPVSCASLSSGPPRWCHDRARPRSSVLARINAALAISSWRWR